AGQRLPDERASDDEQNDRPDVPATEKEEVKGAEQKDGAEQDQDDAGDPVRLEPSLDETRDADADHDQRPVAHDVARVEHAAAVERVDQPQEEEDPAGNQSPVPAMTLDAVHDCPPGPT